MGKINLWYNMMNNKKFVKNILKVIDIINEVAYTVVNNRRAPTV